MRTVFLHGTGAAGPRAWPSQAAALGNTAFFVTRVHAGDHPDEVVPQLRDALTPRGHLVAHSYGCVSAVHLAATDPDMVASLILCEPPFVTLTLGQPHTEAHIAGLRPLFDRRDGAGITDEELAVGFAVAVGMPPPQFTPEQLARAARRLRAFTPAWHFDVDVSVLQRVPTLVVTSGTTDFYAEVAIELARHGAHWIQLPGHGHRVQDHPDATAHFQVFWASAPA